MRKSGSIAAVLVVLAAACSRSDKSPAPPEPATADSNAAHPRKHEDRHDPVIADAPPLQLAVAIDGAAAATWHQDAFDKVARFTGNTKASDGEARNVWSLRELAHALVGPTARVTAVTGDDGTRPIAAAAWSDATRTPLLHTTRRGTLKFRWANAEGKWGETEVKDVTRIEIAR